MTLFLRVLPSFAHRTMFLSTHSATRPPARSACSARSTRLWSGQASAYLASTRKPFNQSPNPDQKQRSNESQSSRSNLGRAKLLHSCLLTCLKLTYFSGYWRDDISFYYSEVLFSCNSADARSRRGARKQHRSFPPASHLLTLILFFFW